LGIESEITCTFDIAIAPLPDTEFTRGKCGFKIIEYMAAGVPVIASPVGVQTDMIEHGENGFLANSIEEWVSYITALAENDGLRKHIGQAGRDTATAKYDFRNSGKLLAKVIRSVCK
jgi:glycosyltransferase involved in cell wall biosynthesis